MFRRHLPLNAGQGTGEAPVPGGVFPVSPTGMHRRSGGSEAPLAIPDVQDHAGGDAGWNPVMQKATKDMGPATRRVEACSLPVESCGLPVAIHSRRLSRFAYVMV